MAAVGDESPTYRPSPWKKREFKFNKQAIDEREREREKARA